MADVKGSRHISAETEIDRPISEYRRNLDKLKERARKNFTPIDTTQFNDSWMFTG